MSEDVVGRVRLRTHLLFVTVIGLFVTAVALFLNAHPTECQPGYRVVSTWLTQFCAAVDAKR